jgi:hypothetical protein
LHPILKILIGLLLIVGGAYWIFYGIGSSGLVTLLGITPNTPLVDFLVLVSGGVPPFLVLIGLFVVWLEWDEWKIEKELRKEERRARRKR